MFVLPSVWGDWERLLVSYRHSQQARKRHTRTFSFLFDNTFIVLHYSHALPCSQLTALVALSFFCITIHLLFLILSYDSPVCLSVLPFVYFFHDSFLSRLQACVDLSKWTMLLGSSMVCDPQIQNVSFIIETTDSQEGCQSSCTSDKNVGTAHRYPIILSKQFLWFSNTVVIKFTMSFFLRLFLF